MSDRIAPYPGGYRAVTRTGNGPVVFAFHGTGGTATQMSDLARKILPDAPIVAPEGDVLENGSARFFRRTGKGVYDRADLAARTDKMARFVADIARGNPVYGFGYSNGANILASVLMAYPTLFARAALLHPLIPWVPEPQPALAHLRVLITGGKRDPICPLSLTMRLADWYQSQGSQVDTLWHPGGHELIPAELGAVRTLLTDN